MNLGPLAIALGPRAMLLAALGCPYLCPHLGYIFTALDQLPDMTHNRAECNPSSWSILVLVEPQLNLSFIILPRNSLSSLWPISSHINTEYGGGGRRDWENMGQMSGENLKKKEIYF